MSESENDALLYQSYKQITIINLVVLINNFEIHKFSKNFM